MVDTKVLSSPVSFRSRHPLVLVACVYSGCESEPQELLFHLFPMCAPPHSASWAKGKETLSKTGTKGPLKRRLSFVSRGCMAHFDAGQFPSVNQSSASVLCSYLEISQSPPSVSCLQRKQMSTGTSFTFCSLSSVPTPKIAGQQEIYHWHLIK